MSAQNDITLREELVSHFGESLDDEVLEKCVELCRMYNLSGPDIFYKWEAMTFGSSTQLRVLNKDSLNGFRDHLRRNMMVSKPKKIDASKTVGKNVNFLRSGLMKSGGGSNPFFGLHRIKAEQQLDVIATEGKSHVGSPSRCNVDFSLEEPVNANASAYRYMYEKISERSEILDDQIEEMAQIAKDYYGILEFGDPSAITEEEIVVVGRVTLDNDASSAGPVKLNESSLALETSRSMGSGVRVPFKFDSSAKVREDGQASSGIGLFPGAIVVLKGRNGSGEWFTVTEVLPLPIPSTQDVLNKVDHPPPFSMSIACGPFTLDSDLKFRPWQAFLTKLKEDRPDVILLLGPYLDSTHPHLKHGEIDASPDQIFRETLVSRLQEYLDSKEGSLALIAPNVRDVLSAHPVSPQPPLSEDLCKDPRIRCISNPCRFSINGVSIALSSVDILFHLRKEEFFKRLAPTDLAGGSSATTDSMANLCRHILEQRSFYPIFPVPHESCHEVNLDVTHSEYLKLCPTGWKEVPDVIIVPSRLKQFSKTVGGTTFVNPSFLTKGTYARLSTEDGQANVEAAGLIGSITTERLLSHFCF